MGGGRGVSFQSFPKKGKGVQIFSINRGEGVGKRKGAVSLIVILTNPFQCYLVFHGTNLV